MSVFEKHQIEKISSWNEQLNHSVKLELVLTDHAEGKQIEAVGQALEQTAPNLSIERVKADTGLPGFRIKENILFSAFPLQKEFDPFMEALSFLDGSLPELPENVRQDLDAVSMPVMLKLYIALACPHCPAMVKTVIPLAVHCKNIFLEIIDGSLFTEKAQADNVLSAPCLILDDDFRWTEYVDSLEITDMLTQRDPSRLGARTLKTILENGDAEWITDQMVEKGLVFESFYKLLLHETWSVRLGAMVVVEDLGERAPEIAASMCPVLIDAFKKHDISIQGDILYALGEAGSEETLDWIKNVLPTLEHEDLIDAAKDAMETLESNV